MTEPTPDITAVLPYALDTGEPHRGRTALLLRFAGGVLVAYIPWSTWNNITWIIEIGHYPSGGVDWAHRFDFVLSGVDLSMTLGQFLILTCALALTYLLGAVQYFVAAARLRKPSRFWPRLAFAVALLQVPLTLGDLIRGSGSAFVTFLPYRGFSELWQPLGMVAFDLLSLALALILIYHLPRYLASRHPADA